MSSFQLWYLVGGGYLERYSRGRSLRGDERFDWNWRIVRGLLIRTRWILMKKRLETGGESSSWNIVLHRSSTLVISLTRTLHILLPLSPIIFIRRPKMDARAPFNLSNYHVSRNFDSIFGVSHSISHFSFVRPFFEKFKSLL